MKTSIKGIKLLEEFEGFSATPYRDSGGLLTIGYGHLIKPGEVFGAISGVEAQSLLQHDVEIAEYSIGKMVSVPLTQNQYDALVCFVYNVGGHAFLGSTLLKKLNLRDYKGAALEFLRWDKVLGKEVQGLLNRRMKEKELFEEVDDAT